MDSILYNQEVTAEILNDIAIDLGATSFNGFGEEKFGADALNAITADLVGKGILDYGGKCQPIKSGESINIQTGIIVFSNGAKKKIEEVVALALEKNSYIYAKNDVLLGVCELVAADTAPQSGDFVMIAQVDNSGNVLDVREFSKAKVAIPTAIPSKITYNVSGGVYDTWTLLGECPCPSCEFWISHDKKGALHVNLFGEAMVEVESYIRIKVEKVGDVAHVYALESSTAHFGKIDKEIYFA